MRGINKDVMYVDFFEILRVGTRISLLPPAERARARVCVFESVS